MEDAMVTVQSRLFEYLQLEWSILAELFDGNNWAFSKVQLNWKNVPNLPNISANYSQT